jgi:glycosyltransferase involved in cell wall biosynthesis
MEKQTGRTGAMSDQKIKKVKYSIIIPTYNRVKKIKKAVTSVLNQSVSCWELIIVDDGSTDKTKEYINSIRDNRIKYIYQDNKGPAASRNTGIRKAKGQYICFLDSDDEYFHDHLESFEEVVNKNNKKFIVSDSIIRRENSDYVDKPRLHNGYVNPNHVPCMQSVCLQASLAKTTLFNEHIRMKEDVEFWLRVSQHATPVFTNKVTSRVNQDGDDRVSNMTISKAKNTLSLFEEIFSDPSLPVYSSSIVKARLFPLHVVLALHYKEKREVNLALKHYFRAIKLAPSSILKRWSISLATKMAWAKIRGLGEHDTHKVEK